MVKQLGFLAVAFAVAALAACASVADLELHYTAQDAGTDAGTTTPVTTAPDAAEAMVIAAPPRRDPSLGGPDPSTLGNEGAGCPCDDTQGLACCSAAPGAFCTTDRARCDEASGGFFRCFGPDPEGSYCCLHRYEATMESGLAAECKPGTSIVCTKDADCPKGDTCTLSACPGGVTIGTCDGTPVCPSPG